MDFFNLLKRVSNLKWATDDPIPKTFDDVLETSKIAMQQALIELWHTYPFTFKKVTRYQVLPAYESAIEAPMGTLTAVCLENGRVLEQVETFGDMDDSETPVYGTPECYRLVQNNTGDKIEFYPTPLEPVTIGISYDTACMARDKSGTERVNLSAQNDTININGAVQRELFENALILLTEVYLIQDSSDENYIPYFEAYQRALRLLINYGITPLKKKVVI